MILKGGGASGDLNGFLDSGSQIEGDLRFDDTFRIDGRVTGKIFSEGDLIVGEGGEVHGEVHVARVFVSGLVKGEVNAARRLEISPCGKVKANVKTAALVIEEGGFFEGQCAMLQGGQGEAEGASPQLVKPVPLKKTESSGT